MRDFNNWIAACGIDCSKCSIHNRTKEELDYWKSQNVDLDTIRCDGCRSDRDKYHWSADCELLDCCIYKKNLTFCSDCSVFPCQIYSKWASEFDHHQKALKEMYKMKKLGRKKYFSKRKN